ncbi:MAG: polyphosphate polymerase domain-containing protein [Eubacterium sp.]|nr:polyphosphate polymerase domain-containing protein [Eubacterium sp.]
MLDVSRKELKYIIRTDDTALLEQRIGKIMDPDSNNRSGSYTVRSLYFDSFGDTDYNEKLDGLTHRKKIRIRIYNGSDALIKLELKIKDGGFQRKRSIRLSREEAEDMIRGDYLFLMERPEATAHALYTIMETRGYRPKIIVEYDRTAFAAETNEIRVTFDKAIRVWTDPEDFFDPKVEPIPVTDPSETTMEVKYNGFLYSHIREALRVADRSSITNSKYVRARSYISF